MCTGDAERQREEHVNQEAVEVVEYILVARNTRAMFMYIVNIRVVVSIFLRNIATTFLFYFLCLHFAQLFVKLPES